MFRSHQARPLLRLAFCFAALTSTAAIQAQLTPTSPVQVIAAGTDPVPLPTAAQHVPLRFSPTSVFWELRPQDKRGTFAVRTYMPNFVLPVHYTDSINRYPSSPTQPALTQENQYRQLGAKIQISLRTKVMEGLFHPNADLWFAYTQRSLWQVWNREDSAPFRSTDHQPEVIYVYPIPESMSRLPFDWRWRMLQGGWAHQSNGQSDPLSRSWDRTFVGLGFERGEIGLGLKFYKRIPEGGTDDNPGITRYAGDTDVVLNWFPGSAIASMTWRTHLASLANGSVQLDWTYPINRDRNTGARWYVQLFTGYGESLLDYNHRQTSIGVGVSLFQF